MNPIVFAVRRPITALMMIVTIGSGGILWLSLTRADQAPPPNAPRTDVYLHFVGKHAQRVKGYVVGQYEKYFQKHEEQVHHEEHKIVVTSPMIRDVVITEPYVCQIHSQRHIKVCALDGGYLQEIAVKEGQLVKKGDLMFKILPILYETKLDAEKAEADLAELEYKYTQKLSEEKVVSKNEVALLNAKMKRAQAKRDLAKAELNFTNVVAPYDGIVDRQYEQLGSLIKEGELLTTLSDNSVMWVYFNVPESRYLEYMAGVKRHEPDPKVELMLANGEKFNQTARSLLVEAKFNNETGNISFRADFPNPDRLLRHGQTGTVLLSKVQKKKVVIPQRATFEILAKRYVYTLDKDGKAHQKEIEVGQEQDDIFVVTKGVDVSDKIVLEGIRQVHEGEEVHYEFNPPELVMAHLKNHAE